MEFKKSFKALLGLLLLFQVAYTIFLFSIGYNDIVHLILSRTGKLHKIQEFQNAYLTASKFYLIRYLFLSLTILYAIVCYYLADTLYKILNRIVYAISKEAKKNFNKLHTLEKHDKIILLSVSIFFILYRLYHIIILPISYDEGWSYLNFFSKNVIVSALYYPAPNNHILYSIFANLFTLIPIDPKIAIRLPNLFVGLFSALLIYVFFKDFFNENIALMGYITFSSLFPTNLYSIHARGYMLIALFSILIIFPILKLTLVRNRKIYWVTFIIASILGFYTIPTFLYPFGSVCLFAVIAFVYKKNYLPIKYLIYSGAIIVIVTALLYLPTFYISGTDALLNNANIKNVKGETHIKLEHLQSTANWLWGINTGGTLLMAVMIIASFLGSVFLKKTNNKLMALFIFTLFLLPIIFVFAQNVLAYERTWIYLTIIIILFLSVTIFQVISDKIQYFSKKINYLFLLPMLLLTNFNHIYDKICSNDFTAGNFAQQYLIHSSFQNIYINYDYYDIIITYNLSRVNNTIKIDRHDSYDQNKLYDYLILRKSNRQFTPDLEGYILDYEDQSVKGYKKL